MLPRFGNNFIIKNEYQNVSWYGRGPHENYQDRKTAALIGSYSAKVADLYFPYIRPQENGTRTDTRILSFSNDSGEGMEIIAQDTFDFSAHHQLNADFDAGRTRRQRHTSDIFKRDLVNVNIDYKQMGVGGCDSWGALPLKKYRIPAENLIHSFIIKPLR